MIYLWVGLCVVLIWVFMEVIFKVSNSADRQRRAEEMVCWMEKELNGEG